MPSKFIDPYIDQASGVLKNLVGAKTYDELRNAEGELVSSRMSDFIEKLPFEASGTLEDFCAIHRYLFQDIYSWAGEIRTVEIRKASEGSEFFLPSSNIPMGIAWAQEELKKDGMLKNMDPCQFAERLSYHYDNYNFVHPFREGNGRTQRLFWTILCHSAGYDLDWREVSGEENDEASRAAAEDRDFSKLIDIFERISQRCDPETPLNGDLLKAIRLESR